MQGGGDFYAFANYLDIPQEEPEYDYQEDANMSSEPIQDKRNVRGVFDADVIMQSEDVRHRDILQDSPPESFQYNKSLDPGSSSSRSVQMMQDAEFLDNPDGMMQFDNPPKDQSIVSPFPKSKNNKLNRSIAGDQMNPQEELKEGDTFFDFGNQDQQNKWNSQGDLSMSDGMQRCDSLDVNNISHDSGYTDPSHSVSSEQSFSNYKRKDVVYKTILRTLRKAYLTEFQSLTKYLEAKRNTQNPQFFLVCLKNYVAKEFKNYQIPDDMEFLLGSMFYYKDMDKLCTSEAKHQECKHIYQSLYNYSDIRLENIFQKANMRFLLYHYEENYFQQNLKTTKTFMKSPQDFETGFEHLKQRFPYRM